MRKIVQYMDASEAQAIWAGCDDPRKILEVGFEYEVEEAIERSWHTRIKLVGIEGWFNSTCFNESKMLLAEAIEEIEEERS